MEKKSELFQESHHPRLTGPAGLAKSIPLHSTKTKIFEEYKKMKSSVAAALGLVAALVFAAGTAQAADAAKGEKAFAKCKACHTIDKGGKNRVGPNLHGVVGRKAGTVDGYKYSKGMMESGLTWDEATLDKYLEKPKDVVPKTKMAFAGVKKADERADLIAYLKANGN
jgi:cytochrome c